MTSQAGSVNSNKALQIRSSEAHVCVDMYLCVCICVHLFVNVSVYTILFT